MDVLVTYDSRHGSTAGIAEAIANELVAQGVRADCAAVESAGDPAEYGAVVLGSAVYMGGWMPEAVKFAGTHREALISRPVWLFSSGPIGEHAPAGQGDPKQVPDLLKATGAREHRMFAGKLDKSKLGFFERTIARVVRTPGGDFRDWDEVRAWAREIAASLLEEAQTGNGRPPGRSAG